MVVIGKHFEKLDSYSKEVLDTILNRATALDFYEPSAKYPPLYNYPENQVPVTWPFLEKFTDPVQGELPEYAPAENGVDIYRVAFRSWIPEQQRYTTNYGLMSIPTDAVGDVPVVVWQQQTVFDPLNSAPSLAFSCGPGGACPQQAKNIPVRFQVAQFGGKGYAVFMPDGFGLGNSNKFNNYAYLLKASTAQWSNDFYAAATSLLEAQNLNESHLFLAGWSAGGVESGAWLENIESRGGTVDGVAIAASPLSIGPATRTGIFTPRPWTDTNTGDAMWLGVAVGFNAFSLGGYQGLPGTALDLLGANYEIARRFYTGDYTAIPNNKSPYYGPAWPSDTSTSPDNGITLKYTDVNGTSQTAFMPYRLTDLIVPKYSDNEVAYDNSTFAKLVNAAGSGLAPWTSSAYLQYSQQDEVLSVAMGKTVYSWQQLAYNKQNITFAETTYANHRGSFLIALQDYLDWFDGIIAQGEVQ
jgi:hypothetical protein